MLMRSFVHSRRVRSLGFLVIVSILCLWWAARMQINYLLPDDNHVVSRKKSSQRIIHVFKTNFVHFDLKSKEMVDTQLQLFQSFSFPSMVGQTDQDFVWIVSIERNAEATLIDRLSEILRPYPHFYLVSIMLDRKFEAGQDVLRKTESNSFYTGNTRDLLALLQQSTEDDIFLETRFNLDDALSTKYVETLKVEAETSFHRATNGREAMYWCANRTLQGQWRRSTREDFTEIFQESRAIHNQCDASPITVGLRPGKLTISLPARDVPHLPTLLEQNRQSRCGMEKILAGLDCLSFLNDKMVFPALHSGYPLEKESPTNSSRVPSSSTKLTQLSDSFSIDTDLIQLLYNGFNAKNNPGHLERDAFITNTIATMDTLPNIHEMNDSTFPRVYNDGEMFHFIKTRFMQHQPNLLALGKARLELFRIFCLPSMVRQTTQNFFWLIYVDPALDKGLLKDLIDLVAPYSHFYVIPSLKDQRGLAGKDILSDVKPKEFLSGNTKILFANLKRSKKLMVLESRFDADDALNINYVKEIQRRAHEVLGKHDNPSGREWIWWCIHQEIEWHWMPPGERKQLSTLGALVTSENFVEMQKCYAPGMTIGRAVNFTGAVVRGAHQTLVEDLAQDNTPCGGQYSGLDCVEFLKSPDWPALRTRTPTSASMANVGLLGGQTYRFVAEHAVELWEAVFLNFPVEPQSLQGVISYLSEHMEAVLGDALEGQCTAGHSCRAQAKEMLQSLLQIYRKQGG